MFTDDGPQLINSDSEQTGGFSGRVVTFWGFTEIQVLASFLQILCFPDGDPNGKHALISRRIMLMRGRCKPKRLRDSNADRPVRPARIDRQPPFASYSRNRDLSPAARTPPRGHLRSAYAKPD